MLSQNKTRLLVITVCGFFLLFDRYLKSQALDNWIETKLIKNYFGWQPFLNKGAAFSLSIPNWLIIILTAIIIGFIFFLLSQEYNNSTRLWAWSLILTGALSNLFDRLFYKHVVDYIMFVTGIINIADVLIVSGLIIYLITTLKKTSPKLP